MTEGLRIGVDAVPFQAKKAGVARYVGNMLRWMRELAPDIQYVLYALDDIDPPPGLSGPVIRVERHRDHRSRAQYWLRRTLPRWLAEDEVDVFWGQNVTMPLRLRRPCARVLTIHDLTAFVCPQTMAVRSWLQSRLLFRQAARVADCVVAVSSATAQGVRRFLQVKSADLKVVSEGCDETIRPVPRRQARELVAEKLGLPDRFLLTVSTIEPRKDYPVLLRALDSIPDAPVLAIVGGQGWRCRHIMKQIAAREARGRVRYLGRIGDAELSLLYSAADLMVYPSVYEGFGLPVLEAMSCGCPVLCSWSSSLPEVGGGAARYFRPRDHEDLAHQLKCLLSRRATLDQMSTAGRNRARRFSFRVAAGELVSILHQQAKKRSSGLRRRDARAQS